MLNSRKLEDLNPIVRAKAVEMKRRVEAELGVELIFTSTVRDDEAQNALYAQGRTKPGKIVTNAKAGYSWHNYKLAFDVVPIRHGKPVWGTSGEDGKLWNRIGEIGEECGLEWAGRWKTFKETAHFQYTQGLTLAQLRGGAMIA